MDLFFSINRGWLQKHRTGFCFVVFLSHLLSGLFFPAHAAVCVPPTISSNPAAPLTQFLRGYRYDFNSPLRLSLNSSGDLFIADPRKGEVVVRAFDGRVIHVLRGLGRPGAISVDSAGRIYVGDLNDGAISVFDSDWNLVQRFAGDIQQIGDLALDEARGRVYVSDSEAHQVQVYSNSGTPLFVIGGPGSVDGLFQYPSGVFYDAQEDELLVSDQFGYRIQVFDADGQFKYCIGGSSARPGGFFQRGRLLAAPQGLWADPQGRVYVADSYDGKIKVLNRRGVLLGEIGSFGKAEGELRIPSDVVMDASGRLYVASTNNARIEMFGIDSYTDPEVYTPALMEISPALISSEDSGVLSVTIMTPGVRAADIVTDSLRLNASLPQSVRLTDNDRDGKAEILAQFDLAGLLANLPASGQAELVLDGIAGTLRLHARASIEITPPAGGLDSDSDGIIDDLDQCPATASGEQVDSDGCSIAQLCPCDGFKGHGGYVKCVSQVSKRLVREELLERKARKQLIRQAARSDCGKGRHKKRHRRGDDDRGDDADETEIEQHGQKHEHEHEEHEHEDAHRKHEKHAEDDDSGDNHQRRRNRR